jgi:hypothetical protein
MLKAQTPPQPASAFSCTAAPFQTGHQFHVAHRTLLGAGVDRVACTGARVRPVSSIREGDPVAEHGAEVRLMSIFR